MQITLKQISFILAIAGIATLIVIMNVSPAIKITSQENLSSLRENQKVIVSGKVIRQNPYYITLDNNISLFCESCPSFRNKNISSEGIISVYKGKTQVSVLKISLKS